MTEEKLYKYIQITTGDTLIAKVDMSKAINGFVKLEKPLKMIVREDNEMINYSFVPWIPFTDDEIIPLNSKSIVTIAALNEDSVEIYKQALAETEEINESYQTSDLDTEIGYLN